MSVMRLRINLTPKPSLRPQNPAKFLGSRAKSRVGLRCSSDNNVGDTVALRLSREVEKKRVLLAQRHEAMEKSRDILFRELCLYLSMETEEVRSKWRLMEEDDKWVLVTGFVSRWALHFHPLSARSVKELVDEELLGHRQQNGHSKHNDSSSSPSSFPNLKKLMGFEHNDD